MPSAGFEPAIPAIEHMQTYPLGRTATGIGLISIMAHIITSATISSIAAIATAVELAASHTVWLL